METKARECFQEAHFSEVSNELEKDKKKKSKKPSLTILEMETSLVIFEGTV